MSPCFFPQIFQMLLVLSIAKLRILQNLDGSIFAWLFVCGCLFVIICLVVRTVGLSGQEQTRLSPDHNILDKTRQDKTRPDQTRPDQTSEG